MAGKADRTLHFDVENLPAAVDPGLGIDPVRTNEATIGVSGEFRRLKSVGRATVGAATLGLFAFRISHLTWGECGRQMKTDADL